MSHDPLCEAAAICSKRGENIKFSLHFAKTNSPRSGSMVVLIKTLSGATSSPILWISMNLKKTGARQAELTIQVGNLGSNALLSLPWTPVNQPKHPETQQTSSKRLSRPLWLGDLEHPLIMNHSKSLPGHLRLTPTATDSIHCYPKCL